MADLNSLIYKEWTDSNNNKDQLVFTLEQLSNAEANKQYRLDQADLAIKSTTDEISNMSSDNDVMTYSTLKAAKDILTAERAKIYQEYLSNNKDTLEGISKQLGEIKKLNEEKSKLQNDSSKALEDIKKLKQNMQTVNWADLQSTPKTKTAATRAEDQPEFNIYIRYNGLTHKILKRCVLTGHNHAISAGDGSSVKEAYSFIAHSIV